MCTWNFLCLLEKYVFVISFNPSQSVLVVDKQVVMVNGPHAEAQRGRRVEFYCRMEEGLSAQSHFKVIRVSILQLDEF